jgi:hypothetical protein
LRGNVIVAKEKAGTCLALSAEEEAAYLRHLGGTQIGSKQGAQLRALGSMQLHELQATLPQLAKLRNDELFGTWRGELQAALSLVEEDLDPDESAGFIYEELTNSLAKFKKKAAKKTWFENLKAGTHEFRLTAPGVATGVVIAAASGAPGYGVAAAAAQWSITSVIKSLDKRREDLKLQEPSKAMFDLLLTFKPAPLSN